MAIQGTTRKSAVTVVPAGRSVAPTGFDRVALGQALFYGYVDKATTFVLNELTGKPQSLADKQGWLVRETA